MLDTVSCLTMGRKETELGDVDIDPDFVKLCVLIKIALEKLATSKVLAKVRLYMFIFPLLELRLNFVCKI